MSALYWSKAAPGSYYLRRAPGGRGPAVGRIWSAISEKGGAAFYNAMYDVPEAFINFTERGQPKTVIAMLEERIKARFPHVTFEREF